MSHVTHYVEGQVAEQSIAKPRFEAGDADMSMRSALEAMTAGRMRPASAPRGR
ncbi:hypothetical protein AB0F44_16940 [Nocardioides sp. NPDC023903]|uniref:hypothetical protein n=1 Tax=Nocardioides sp. NPDC023903 TaxID=3157195 RepID=UPI0033E4BA82